MSSRELNSALALPGAYRAPYGLMRELDGNIYTNQLSDLESPNLQFLTQTYRQLPEKLQALLSEAVAVRDDGRQLSARVNEIKAYIASLSPDEFRSIVQLCESVNSPQLLLMIDRLQRMMNGTALNVRGKVMGAFLGIKNYVTDPTCYFADSPPPNDSNEMGMLLLFLVAMALLASIVIVVVGLGVSAL